MEHYLVDVKTELAQGDRVWFEANRGGETPNAQRGETPIETPIAGRLQHGVYKHYTLSSYKEQNVVDHFGKLPFTLEKERGVYTGHGYYYLSPTAAKLVEFEVSKTVNFYDWKLNQREQVIQSQEETIETLVKKVSVAECETRSWKFGFGTLMGMVVLFVVTTIGFELGIF